MQKTQVSRDKLKINVARRDSTLEVNMSGKYVLSITYRVFAFASIVFTITSCGNIESLNEPLPAGIVHTLNNANSGQTVSVSLKDTIIIRLQTIGPGEFGTQEISSSSIQFVKMLPTSKSEINPGGPVQYYQFVAYLQGRAEISIPHTYNSDVFTVTINVE
jgi:carbonic anhydrase